MFDCLKLMYAFWRCAISVWILSEVDKDFGEVQYMIQYLRARSAVEICPIELLSLAPRALPSFENEHPFEVKWDSNAGAWRDVPHFKSRFDWLTVSRKIVVLVLFKYQITKQGAVLSEKVQVSEDLGVWRLPFDPFLATCLVKFLKEVTFFAQFKHLTWSCLFSFCSHFFNLI